MEAQNALKQVIWLLVLLMMNVVYVWGGAEQKFPLEGIDQVFVEDSRESVGQLRADAADTRHTALLNLLTETEALFVAQRAHGPKGMTLVIARYCSLVRPSARLFIQMILMSKLGALWDPMGLIAA